LHLKKKIHTKENKKFISGDTRGLPTSFFLIYITLEYEKTFNIQGYEIGETCFFVLFFLFFLEAAFIFFWSLLGFITKRKEKGFNTKGIYAFVRHPICTLIVFHVNILTSLWFGSYLLLFLIPLQYLLWLKIIVREEKYLVGIFGQEYIDYMSNVSRFIPWK